MKSKWNWVIFILVLGHCFDAYASTPPILMEEPHGVRAETMGLVINDADPLSRNIAAYYQTAHGFPDTNVIHVSFPVDQGTISRAVFETQYEVVKRKTPDHIQAYALAWWRPYKVDCLSITTAFAFGFDERFCAQGCRTTRYSPYFSSSSDHPWRDHKIRPSMAIAAQSLAKAKALIDRGKSSFNKWPNKANGFVLETTDKARSVRKLDESAIEGLSGVPNLTITQEKNNELRGARDLMFYFTGLASVSNLDRNIYLPGAMADHLTSFGGALEGTGQMSALKWLEGGATGSYGAVSEPCNFTAKFPNPQRAIEAYTQGETLIEAYWKSVAMPGQGLFIGDPLARPWGGYQASREGNAVVLKSRRWKAGKYVVSGSSSEDGEFRLIGSGVLPPNDHEFVMKANPEQTHFRVQRLKPSSNPRE